LIHFTGSEIDWIFTASENALNPTGDERCEATPIIDALRLTQLAFKEIDHVSIRQLGAPPQRG
jgi:hypothetical protein